MTRIRRTRSMRWAWTIAVGLALAVPGSLPAQPAKPSSSRPPEPPKPKELALSPAAAPVPALKYRFLPSAAELNPGDAAPIYLRIHGYEDTSMEPLWRQIGEKGPKWLDLPLDRFPAGEVRQFLGPWGRKLEQLEFGTRRKTCDWNYTLPEQRSRAVEIILPDAQSMRQWGRLLALKARVEIAEKKYDDAVHTIETGLAFARHVGGGPFLINGLIGIAISNQLLTEAEELIAQPGAPNLYWALTALPRPLVGLRDQAEIDQKMIEYVIPELGEAEAARPREAVEWAPYLARIHAGIVRWSPAFTMENRDSPWAKALPSWTLARLRSESLPAARDYLKAVRGLKDEQLAEMPEDQVVALYLAGRYRELNDEAFKAMYLPVREAIPSLTATEERLRPLESGPLALAVMNVRAIRTMLASTSRPERHIAALRVIEAIRLYAAAHDGKLPESLDQITEVPVPEDPATARPFVYRRAGEAAILHGPQSDLPHPAPTYRITIRR